VPAATVSAATVSAATVPAATVSVIVFFLFVFFLFVFILGVFILGVRVARARTADQFEGKTALVIVVVFITTVTVIVVAVFLLRWVEAIRIRREVIFVEHQTCDIELRAGSLGTRSGERICRCSLDYRCSPDNAGSNRRARENLASRYTCFLCTCGIQCAAAARVSQALPHLSWSRRYHPLREFSSGN